MKQRKRKQTAGRMQNAGSRKCVARARGLIRSVPVLRRLPSAVCCLPSVVCCLPVASCILPPDLERLREPEMYLRSFSPKDGGRSVKVRRLLRDQKLGRVQKE